MHSGQTGWLILFVFAIFLIVVGVQGNLGVLTAIIFCPKYIMISSDSSSQQQGS
jgi:hypothetical protein